MKPTQADFALAGGTPSFAETIPFGQYFVPDEAGYRGVLERIAANGYFTNHGPLAREFEASLAEYLGVAHVVLCTNESLGLSMALKGMQIDGPVLVPALGYPELVESVLWAGLEPVFCDVDPVTHQISPELLDAAAHDGAGAVVLLEMWGNRCDANGLVEVAERNGLQTLFYAADGFGSAHEGRRVARPDQTTLFSFQSSRLLSTMEGGCLATDDDHFAAVLRNIRSSYGAGAPTAVPVTANGRFSELQAGLGLWGLQRIDTSLGHNRALCDAYRNAIGEVPGLTIYGVSQGVQSNHQCLVLRVDSECSGPSRDELLKILAAERVITSRDTWPCLPERPGFSAWAKGESFPVAEQLAQELLLLPVGSGVSVEAASKIGGLVAAAGKVFSQQHSSTDG
ncbi:MAG: dTDP-4-amino-4,6-dideoxygalactose transaminase [Chlamydiales bacterium]